MGVGVLCLAWANPQWGTRKETVKTESSDIYIALDISQSMMASDIAPNRLERSKQWAQMLIDRLGGNRVGLIFFAGGAYVQMPLSYDHAAAKIYLRAANTEQASTQGTAIDEAIALAANSYQEGSPRRRAVVIISDGEDHDQKAVDAINNAAQDGLVAYTVAVGTESGGYIPYNDQGKEAYKKDQDGRPVKTQVNLEYLRDIAKAGDGRFYLVNDGKEAISSLQTEISKLEKRESEVRSFTDYNSYFQYLIAIALLLMGLTYWVGSFKKSLSIASGLLVVCTISAQDRHQLLKQGDETYTAGGYSAAEEAYRKADQAQSTLQSSYNLGNTLYKQDRLDEAAEQYERASMATDEDPLRKAHAYHNLGNARYSQEDYEGALQAYKQSLSYDPQDIDTKNNLLMAKQRMIQQQQQEQQQQEQKQQEPSGDPEEKDQQEEQSSPPSEEQQEEKNEKEEGQEGESSDQDQDSKQEARKSDELSKEDAENLLRIAGQEEQKVQEKLRKGKSNKKPPKKDW